MNNDTNSLMSHQTIHLNKLENTPFSGLGIFDDVGTGKTISTLNVVNYHLSKFQSPILLLVPPSLIEKWVQECRKWCRKRVNVARYVKGELALVSGINILSHGRCKGKVPRKLPKIGLLVIDEAHHFRNESTQSSKIVHQFCESSERRLILTATPIQNSSNDLVTITNLILPTLTREVVQAIVSQAMGMNDSSLFRPIMTRCTPSTNDANRVVKEHLVRMTESERTFLFEIFKTKRESNTTIFSEISKMKMAASSVSTLQNFTGHNLDIPDSKVAYTSSLVNKICDDGKKAIVFSEFINTAKEISYMLDTNLIGTITGETPPDVRNSLLTGLKHCKSGAIVMTDVGGEGLDMQFVDCIVNHDLPWNPMVLEQRIGRLDRIGRDDREIMIHNILLEDSLDSHIINILKNKEMVTHKFGGYGIMIDPISTLSSLNSSIHFSSLSSEIYERDLDNSESNDYTSLSEESKELLDIISQLN